MAEDQHTDQSRDPTRQGRGAGQPRQSPQTDRQPTREPQTARNESIKQSLALPRDRDESVAMTGGTSAARHEPDPQIEQAARDLAAGLKDTSRAPEMDRSYKKMSGKPDE